MTVYKALNYEIDEKYMPFENLVVMSNTIATSNVWLVVI